MGCHFEKVSTPDQLSTFIEIQSSFGKQKRSAQNFGYNNSQQNYGGSHYQGGSHNFGSTQNFRGSHFQGGNHNFGPQSYNQRQWKRSAQNFGYNNSRQNYGGSHYQGGSHNFGSLQNYSGSHFQGGNHNFGMKSYNQNQWNSRW